jgi:transposase-like protein
MVRSDSISATGSDRRAGVRWWGAATAQAMASQVLSVYEELGSIRKTAQAVGVSKSTVQRIVNRAA